MSFAMPQYRCCSFVPQRSSQRERSTSHSPATRVLRVIGSAGERADVAAPEELLAPPGRFPAFASRNYRLFFGGQLISVTGTWMQTLAQSYLVYDVLHASPFQLGLVNVFQFAPVLLFG